MTNALAETAKDKAQAQVLGCLEAGMTVREACRHAGRSVHTYERWLENARKGRSRQDVEFAARVSFLRDRQRDPEQVTWNGDFRSFRKVFFGFETFVHQEKLVSALETVGAREVVLVLLWPEAGKTQTLTDWICWTLARDPNRRIAVLSEAQDHARKIVSHIKTRMTDTTSFADYIVRFGPFHEDRQERQGKPWSANYLTVAKAGHDERDYSLSARAIGSSAYGSRIDDLIVDDVQSEKNLNQTDEILRTLRQTYLTRGRHMRTVIIGTRIANGDIYERLIEQGIIDRLIELPATTAQGEPTCPDIWVPDPSVYETREELVADAKALIATTRRQVTEEIWEASYQQNPQAQGLATFTDIAIDAAKNHDRKIGPAGHGAYVVLSLDPALGGGNALFACEHTPEKCRILDAQIDYGLSTNSQIVGIVETFAANYRPQLLIVETDAQQKGLAADERLADVAKRFGFQIVPHHTAGKKLNNPLAVAAMAADLATGGVEIPWGDENTRLRMAALVDQLRKWRPNVPTKLIRQDAVMSVWFSWHHWTKTRNQMGTASLMDAMKLRALPYEPTPVSVRSLS